MKQKIIIAATIIGILIAFIILRMNSKPTARQLLTQPVSTPSQNDKPQIVSTNPNPLEDNIISATEIVEITFNRPLENVGEFKVRIEPKIDYKVELSGDRKTARIIPAKPYQLGTTYTLFIGTETKFDGVGRWGEEKIFHFRTIKYTGV